MYVFYLFLLFLFSSYLYAADFITLPLVEKEAEQEEGVEETKHNLGMYKGKMLNPNIEGEYRLAVCVWCHTQSISISFIDVRYKWNPHKVVRKFNLYGLTDKGPAVENISPSSMVCLSCHDGGNAPNIAIGQTISGESVHSHPVFIIYRPGIKYLKPYNSPLEGWIGKKHFVYDLVKDYNGRVQCASCHDPHATTDAFLRAPRRGSKICFGCHDI